MGCLLEQTVQRIVREELVESKEEHAEIRAELVVVKGDVADIKVELNKVKIDQLEMKNELRCHSVMLDQASEERQKILEVLSMLVERSDENDRILSRLEGHEQKIEVNKNALKKHINNKIIHLLPSK